MVAFLLALRTTANVAAACRIADVPRRSAYNRYRASPAFAARWDEVLEEAVDDLEAEARRRAVEGVARPVYGSGGPGVGTVQVGEVRDYSDQLLMVLLKSHRPAKFRENVRHEHAGPAGRPVPVRIYLPQNGRD